MKNKIRCAWVGQDELYIDYHDNEWSKPVYNTQQLFEMLCLEGAQAGLSWITILKKRTGYRKAFANFDYKKIAKFSESKIQILRQDQSIVRNQLKIRSVITNAKALLTMEKEGIDFSKYLWSFVGGKPKINKWCNLTEVPAETKESQEMSASLKKHGFKFVGPTICYAFMQAVGMVDDHTVDCFLHNKK
jgi:DNA-3-methyladenine glycosylase I